MEIIHVPYWKWVVRCTVEGAGVAREFWKASQADEFVALIRTWRLVDNVTITQEHAAPCRHCHLYHLDKCPFSGALAMKLS